MYCLNREMGKSVCQRKHNISTTFGIPLKRRFVFNSSHYTYTHLYKIMLAVQTRESIFPVKSNIIRIRHVDDTILIYKHFEVFF